tara:strand:- start:1601 stop:1885 length:285 start_codon:yes stop_codon:yes gene_type:complete
MNNQELLKQAIMSKLIAKAKRATTRLFEGKPKFTSQTQATNTAANRSFIKAKPRNPKQAKGQNIKGSQSGIKTRAVKPLIGRPGDTKMPKYTVG